jgi:uncharacterized metal-binding protein YceD (DUF177 family)
MSSNDTPTQDQILRIADVSALSGIKFDASLTADQIETATEQLSLLGLKKTRLSGDLRPSGADGWTLQARLGATVVQPCTVTLDPVTTRIETVVTRNYVPEIEAPEDVEVEMPEDDTLEPMPTSIDLASLFLEELALNLPQFPRAPGAELGAAVFTEPGKTAMTDDDARPFASLVEFRKSLEGDKK